MDVTNGSYKPNPGQSMRLSGVSVISCHTMFRKYSLYLRSWNHDHEQCY